MGDYLYVPTVEVPISPVPLPLATFPGQRTSIPVLVTLLAETEVFTSLCA